MAHVTLSPEVRAILERSTITATSLKLPPGQLDRRLYEAVNKLITNAGGKWRGGLVQAHVFTSDPRAKLGLALETGVSVDEQKQFQAFYTPPELARQVAELAMVKGQVVLEPSAGQGALVDACFEAGAKDVECIDLNPENHAALIERVETVQICDFLGCNPAAHKRQNYPRIVMNPPFTRDQDIAHVEHALKFLAPGGILVAIMLDSLGREKFQALTGRLDESGAAYSFVKVPEKTFKDTPIRTLILKVTASRPPKSELEKLATSDFASIKGVSEMESPVSQPQPQPTIETNENKSQMKLRIKRTDLSAALAAVKAAAGAKASLPVLANVNLVANEKTVTLTASDLDLTLRAKVEAVVEDKGEITVPCALLHDIVRSVKGDEVFLDLQRKTLHVACGTSKFKLATIASEEFPAFPRINEPVEFGLAEFELHRLLARTEFAHAVGGERPVLNGALLAVSKGALTVVGCDGHRIAVDSLTLANRGSDAVTIIPAKAAAALLQLLDRTEPDQDDKAAQITVKAGKNGVQFAFGDFTIVTKVIEGNYPAYQKVIPAHKAGEGVVIGRSDLLLAVDLVALVGDTCRLEFRKQTLTILSDNPKKDAPGEAVESLLIPASKDATIKLAARFLREALSAIDADEIEFHVTDAGPAVITDGNWLTVIAALKDKPEEKTETKPAVPAKK